MARIDPLPEKQRDESLPQLNIFGTLARHPELLKAWLPYGSYLLTAGTLSARDRELLILRTAVNCQSPYEWGQHVRMSLAGGIDRESIDRVAEGPDDPGLLNSLGVEQDEGLEDLPG